MSIKTQGGKIIRNLAGDVLTESPVISLDWNYGIAKDGSNLVSDWEDKNKPFKFKTPSGKEPTENGNGIEFRANDKYLQSSNGWAPNLDRGFSIRVDLDLLSVSLGQIIGRWYANGVVTRSWSFFYSNPNFLLFLAESGVISGYEFRDINIGYVGGRKVVNIVCQQDESNIYGGVYFNDDIDTIKVTSYPKFTLSTDMSNKLEVGGMANKIVTVTPNINLYSLDLYDYANINILP